MINCYKRWIALILACMLTLGCVACKPSVSDSDAPGDPVTMPLAPENGLPAATTEPLPTPTADASASAAFAALDLEVFCWYVTSDAYSFHQLVSDPKTYGIDPASVAMNWGEFTEEDSKRLGAEAGAFLERLNAIPRSALQPVEQFSYDVLQQYLQDASEETDYEYFYEPLTEYNGLHSTLPMALARYEINNTADAENYLLLLSDLPRYLGQVLAYEQERAARGMFMREVVLDAILTACKTIIDSKDTLFLYATFDEAVDGLEGVDDITRSSLKKRNKELIAEKLIGAYRDLYRGLEDLRKHCSTAEGAYLLGEKGKAYFEYAMQHEGDNKLTADETLELLKSELSNTLYAMINLQQDNPKLFEHASDSVTTGDTNKDLELLRQITARLLPALPEHELTIQTVPEELEEMVAPAMYFIPPMDGWVSNEVWINLAKPDEKALLTLAHETVPGHMYQYLYQRANNSLGLTQRVLHYGAYAEGWSQLAEQLVSKEQTVSDAAYCQYLFAYNILNVLLPAIISIQVNYYGYSKASVKAFLANYITDAYVDMMTESFYKLAIDEPYYTFCYAIGYSQLQQLIRDAEDDLGDEYDQKTFLTAYLDLGPGYFNLVQEQMYVWIDERMAEEAAA